MVFYITKARFKVCFAMLNTIPFSFWTFMLMHVLLLAITEMLKIMMIMLLFLLGSCIIKMLIMLHIMWYVEMLKIMLIMLHFMWYVRTWKAYFLHVLPLMFSSYLNDIIVIFNRFSKDVCFFNQKLRNNIF